MSEQRRGLKARRTVCVVLVDRANYGRLKPVLHAIAERDDLQLQVLATGTMVLERFDFPVHIVEEDGFDVMAKVHVELEGSTPVTMAKSLGFAIIELATEIARLRPEILLVIGDRYEALAATLAAAYMNITVFHLQGGEVSGSIDESARHAITKLAQYHFPSTERARDFIVRMGEAPSTVLGVGCPSSDLARACDRVVPGLAINTRGSGVEIDVNKPFLLAVFHPTTTEYGGERAQVDALLGALDEVNRQTLLLWPNIDAGSDHIAKAIRVFRTQARRPWLRTVTNLTPEDYLRVLSRTACAVGNSSSFVRDASFFGTPVVLVGNRQDGRERGEHVVAVAPSREAIAKAVNAQLEHGRYPPCNLYGDGQVSTRIAAALANVDLFTQKRLDYLGRAE